MSLELPENTKRVETARFGPFAFQIGANPEALEALFLRVTDAQKRFRASPLAQVANRLEKEVVVSSIFGTNSIEGGTLTEEETETAIKLDPTAVKDIAQRRAVNLKTAYDYALKQAAETNFQINLNYLLEVHRQITSELPHEHNQPGLLRDNPKSIVTRVGDAEHGGRYKPPQYRGDIQLLLNEMFAWHEELKAGNVPALIRAPLMHYYFERIHPFWDGNGRVGRALEATVLLNDGFQYAPFAQARYYFEHIDEYFTLFNTCRKLEEKNQANPNTAFIRFFLEGMLTSINKLHDRVNALVSTLVFESKLKRARDEKELNARQYAIVSQVLEKGEIQITELRKAPWYQALYEKKTDKTKQRDLRKLRDEKWLIMDKDERLRPGLE